jgi:hypothetical protein
MGETHVQARNHLQRNKEAYKTVGGFALMALVPGAWIAAALFFAGCETGSTLHAWIVFIAILASIALSAVLFVYGFTIVVRDRPENDKNGRPPSEHHQQESTASEDSAE